MNVSASKQGRRGREPPIGHGRMTGGAGVRFRRGLCDRLQPCREQHGKSRAEDKACPKKATVPAR
jgi:hypothetical protein